MMTMPAKIDFAGTARAAREALAELGVTGAAADALIRETGYARHKTRVQRVLDACLVAVGVEAGYVRYDWEAGFALPAIARADADLWIRAALFADRCGIGGRDGCDGAGTARIPVLSGLGSGRKHAADGGAWDAARDAVLYWVCRSTDLPLEADEVGENPLLPADWRRTMAREGLRRSVGLPGWFPVASDEGSDYDAPAIVWAEDASRWAAVLEAAERDLEAERTAPPVALAADRARFRAEQLMARLGWGGVDVTRAMQGARDAGAPADECECESESVTTAGEVTQ